MGTPSFFADSFYWIALIHPKDAWHIQVNSWRQRHTGPNLVTTEEVQTEVLNWFASLGPRGRSLAASVVRRLRQHNLAHVISQTTSGFDEALALYESRQDKSYSLTDCRSMIAMKQFGLTEVLTNDHHFTQEGFTILFP